MIIKSILLITFILMAKLLKLIFNQNWLRFGKF